MSITSLLPGFARYFRLSLLVLVGLILAIPANATGPAPNEINDGMVLKGDQDGTVFRSLTVDGENRVQIRFERPELNFDIDPNQAPGLMLDDALDILDRTLPDMVAPFLLTSSAVTTPFAPRPWLASFATGPLARFTPVMADVASWKLQVVDSRGQAAMVFAGKGNPPAEIPWDGLRLDGTPAPPGYTYSYVLEAWDDAGNQRRFVGDGFTLPAYRRDVAAGPEFLVSGAQWRPSENRQARPSALAYEIAHWINLRCEPALPVRVVVTHRTAAEADGLAARVVRDLTPLLGGDPQRVMVETEISTAAPPEGTLHLIAQTVRRGAGSGI
jgi:hypothetical protein